MLIYDLSTTGIIRVKTRRRTNKQSPKPKDHYNPGDRVQLDTVITI